MMKRKILLVLLTLALTACSAPSANTLPPDEPPQEQTAVQPEASPAPTVSEPLEPETPSAPAVPEPPEPDAGIYVLQRRGRVEDHTAHPAGRILHRELQRY